MNKQVAIIGGGPSLLKVLPDASILLNRPVISTNNAYTLFPNSIVCHFADRPWWMWHKEKLAAQYRGEITTCTSQNIHSKTLPKKWC